MDSVVLGGQPGAALRILTGNDVLGDMSRWLGRAPVLPEPGERHRVVRTKSEYLVRHWDESMQIEWARVAHSHTGDSAFVAPTHRLSQLSGQHSCSSYAQCARLKGRHQQMKDIFLHAIEVDLPGNDSRARGGMPEGDELICRSNDGEAVVQPIGMRQPHWRGLRFGFRALGRMLTRDWC